MHRKTAPRVRNGRVHKKHRWDVNPPDTEAQTFFLEIIRRAPGPGCVHVIDEHDLMRFTRLFADWPLLSRGLTSIVLDTHDDGCDGFCRYDGVISLPAWRRELIRDVGIDYYRQHREVFARIGVLTEMIVEDPDKPLQMRCWFDAATARAYMLMHIFLHELGHHVDRMSTRSGDDMPRGEEFAEAWALERERMIWPRFREYFGDPRRGKSARL